MDVVDAEGWDGVAARQDFEQFYEREFHQVVSRAFALCGSWSSAEDLAQDAFASAQRRWAKIGGYEQPGAWVRRAVANRSVSLVRRRVVEARAVLRVSRERMSNPEELADTDGEFWELAV